MFAKGIGWRGVKLLATVPGGPSLSRPGQTNVRHEILSYPNPYLFSLLPISLKGIRRLGRSIFAFISSDAIAVSLVIGSKCLLLQIDRGRSRRHVGILTSFQHRDTFPLCPKCSRLNNFLRRWFRFYWLRRRSHRDEDNAGLKYPQCQYYVPHTQCSL